jgi:hypothetical protein
MRVTKHIYKRVQGEFPDLFVEAERAKATSTVFAEFLPGAALADPNGNPWGQYGSREIPPKRKTVVISFHAVADLPFSELEKIDKAAQFLKRAGFSVLIPMGDDLQQYDRQLFDREHITQVGNKTRAEMQRMALRDGVPADEVFFIDDVKKEVDEQFFETLSRKFESIEKEPPELTDDIYCSTEHQAQFIPKYVGRLSIQRSDESFKESELQTIQKNLEKALKKHSSLNVTLDEAFIIFQREREREREREDERQRREYERQRREYERRRREYERRRERGDERHRERIYSDDSDDDDRPAERDNQGLTDDEFLILTTGLNPEQLKEIGSGHSFNVAILIKAGATIQSILSIHSGWRDCLVITLARLIACGHSFAEISQMSDEELHELDSGLYKQNIPEVRQFLAKITDEATQKVGVTRSTELQRAEEKLNSTGLTLDKAFELREQECYGEHRAEAQRKKQLTDYELLLLTITDFGKNLDDLDLNQKKMWFIQSNAFKFLQLIRSGIPFKALANLNEQFLFPIFGKMEKLLNSKIDYTDLESLTEVRLKPIINDDYYLPYVMALVESIKKCKLATPEVGAKKNSYSNLYYLSIESPLGQKQREFLIDHSRSIEELNVQKFEYCSETLGEIRSFQNLTSLTCGTVFGEFNIEAPRLIKLNVTTDQRDVHIHLETLLSLTHFEIDCGVHDDIHSDRKYPSITSKRNPNLTELYIDGNIRSLAFIESLLVDSPNLKVLSLNFTSVPEEDLKILGQRFPKLQIKVSSRSDDSYLRTLGQAASIPSTTLENESEIAPPILDDESEIDTGNPDAVHQSAHRSDQQKQYTGRPPVTGFSPGSADGESPETGLRKCLIDAFAWAGVDSVRESSGKLKEFKDEKYARKVLAGGWRHNRLYEKYQQLITLQTSLDLAAAKINRNKLDSSACDDLLTTLEEIKQFLEEQNEDYKTGFFNRTKKTKTKKGFYDRILNSITKVTYHRANLSQMVTGSHTFPSSASAASSESTEVEGPELEANPGVHDSQHPVLDYLPSPESPASPLAEKRNEDVVYTNSATNELTSDFDTKHAPEIKYTMEQACRHISKNKSKRFQYTRDGIYKLDFDKETLFSSIETHLSSSYEVPAYQAALPTDDSHDFYEFKQKIDLQSGNRYRITSLSSRDILLQLTLNGIPLTDSDIEIKKDELGFYTLQAKKPLNGDLGYLLDVPEEQEGLWNHVPPELQHIITQLQSFPSREVDELHIDADATSVQKLDAMYNQKKAACRHRVAIFLHQLNKLKEAHPEIYEHIQARGVVRGGVHANIEVSVDGGKSFEMLELGGYEAKVHYVSTTLPALHFSSKQKKEAPKPVFTDVLNQIDQSRGKNTLLCLSQSSDIYTCLSHIREKSSGRPIFYVDSPDQLRTSLKRLKLNADRTLCEIVNPPAGLLHDFLIQHLHTDPPPIIVINWENFKPSDMVQFNSVIDVANRRVDNTPISAGTTIVGLHSRSEKMMDLLGDSSFVSRHATGGIHDLTANPIPPPAVHAVASASAAAVSGILRVNLHNSPRWQDILIGKAFVDGDQLRWRDGELAQLIPPSSISHIEFINPPINDRAFNNFIADLRAGLPINFLNQVKPLGRTIDVKTSERPEFLSGVTIEVARSNLFQADAYIINSSTFEQCLHGKKITDEGLLITEKGLLEVHANGVLKLCLSDTLSDSQWSLLLDYAKKFNVTLNLSITRNVTIPSGIVFKERTVSEEAARVDPTNRFIVSDDIEYSVLKLQRELPKETIIVDFSETALDDLFCKTQHRTTDSGFAFNKRLSSIWESLSSGNTVILKGACSQEMLDYLSTLFSPQPYFYLEGQKHFFPGKLIVVSSPLSKAAPWLGVEHQKISLVEKQSLLGLPLDESAQNKSLIQLSMDHRKTIMPPKTILQDAVLPLDSATEVDMQSAASSYDLSLSSCENFEKNRLFAVKHVLAYSPFVLLEGAPGVGKSYFMRSLQSDPSIKFYREDEIEKWATDPDELIDPDDPEKGFKKKILFRDEINLRGTDCSQDRDLLNDPASIFVDGKYYQPSEHCKIMYAQNPLDYGGERHEPKLFQDLPDCKVVFDQMTPAFILHRILKPIFETTFDATESERRATKIIQDHFTSMRSIRDLQTKAIFECSLHRHPIPPTPAVGTKQVCLGLNDFVLTTSRFEPYKDVLTLLQARKFKRELPESAPDGARFNGANGLVLQGPPGVGKSEFIESVLKSEGYSEITHHTPPSAIESGKVYYRLRASLSNEEKLSILHHAFQQGAILIIDEIDSCPLLEDYLNAYLVGEDIHGKRAEKPGFTLFSTANGAEMKGRRVLPAPLKSRMLALEFNEYSREDLVSILHAKFIPPMDPHRQLKLDMISFLVDGFLKEQQSNKETPPTFRDLYVVSKDYFENKFERYARLGFSKQQHEFMLVYRNHPKLSSFIERFESQELKANGMTLDEFDKSLKSTSDEPTLNAPCATSSIEDARSLMVQFKNARSASSQNAEGGDDLSAGSP